MTRHGEKMPNMPTTITKLRMRRMTTIEVVMSMVMKL